MVKAVINSTTRTGPMAFGAPWVVSRTEMWCSSTSATMAAAPPPTPLNRATICGIWVIWTRYAPITPTAVPAAIAIRIGTWWSRSEAAKTITQASTAPAAPIRLPRRAVLGDDRPLSATTKQTAASR